VRHTGARVVCEDCGYFALPAQGLPQESLGWSVNVQYARKARFGSMKVGKLTFLEFAELIRREMEIGELDMVDVSRLVEDLGFDSADMYELMVIVEDLGYHMSLRDLNSWLTLQDVYLSIHTQDPHRQ